MTGGGHGVSSSHGSSSRWQFITNRKLRAQNLQDQGTKPVTRKLKGEESEGETRGAPGRRRERQEGRAASGGQAERKS